MQEHYNIGLGVTTCDRPEFYERCESSLIAILEKNPNLKIVIIDDGLEETKISDCFNNKIKTSGKIGVGKSKNLALKHLMDNKCEHLFLMEDDVEILDGEIFKLYIEASKSSGIKHLNYGLHGNHNTDQNGNPVVRKSVKYPNEVIIDLYPNVLGALSYYHKSVIEDIGYMDEVFYNALEHVEHTLRASLKGYHPCFRWFADVHGSSNYIKDIKSNHQNSKIRSENDFMENFKKNLDIFIEKHNFSVVPNYGPPEIYYTEEQALESLRNIWKSHHQK